MDNHNAHNDEEEEHPRTDSDTEEQDIYDLPEVTFQLSHTHPLYIHPNDNSGCMIVNVVLNESNYSEWSRAMMIALSTKMKLGIINGTHKRPKISSKYLPHWDRCNNMIISWILNTVSPEIRSSIVYTTTARGMWEELQSRFTQGNAPQLYHIKKEINSFAQGALSVNAYYTRFKALWDEFTHLNNTPKCVCDCKCGAVKLLEESEHLQKLTQFLMGLNDQFTSIRGTILSMAPTPSLTKAMSLISQEEKQLGIGITSLLHAATDSSTALYAKSSQSNRISRMAKLYGVKPDPSKMPKYLKPKSGANSAVNFPMSSSLPPLLETPTNTAANTINAAQFGNGNPMLSDAQYNNLLDVINNQMTGPLTTMAGPCEQESERDWYSAKWPVHANASKE